MGKPRLSEGRIPFQLGMSAGIVPPPVTTPAPIEDVYYYDRQMPTGTTTNATILPTESPYD